MGNDRVGRSEHDSGYRDDDREDDHERAPARPVGKRTRSEGLTARVQRAASSSAGEVSADAENALARASGGAGIQLPEGLRARFEGSLGADLSAVRVHTDQASARAARSVGARAYAQGQDIHFGAGEYDPVSSAGQLLLAHEVAHTAQQQDGAQQLQPKLEVSSPGDSHEVEADRAAVAMVAGLATSVSPASGVARRVISRFANPGEANVVLELIRTGSRHDLEALIVALEQARADAGEAPSPGTEVMVNSDHLGSVRVAAADLHELERRARTAWQHRQTSAQGSGSSSDPPPPPPPPPPPGPGPGPGAGPAGPQPLPGMGQGGGGSPPQGPAPPPPPTPAPPTRRVVYLDVNVIDQISRGNRAVAEALLAIRNSGGDLRMSPQAYNELVGTTQYPSGDDNNARPDIQSNFRQLVQELGITRDSGGTLADRVRAYENGVIEVPRRNGPPRAAVRNQEGDTMMMGQAAASTPGAHIWSFDGAVVANARAFGLTAAPECSIATVRRGTSPDYHVARALLGLPPAPRVPPPGGVPPSGAPPAAPPPGGAPPAAPPPGGAPPAAPPPGGAPPSAARPGASPAAAAPPSTAPPWEYQPGSTPRGRLAVGAGAGMQLVATYVNQAISALSSWGIERRVRQDIEGRRSGYAATLESNPGMGVLIVVYIGEGTNQFRGSASYLGMTDVVGRTRAQAMDAYHSRSNLEPSPGPNSTLRYSYTWIPPLGEDAR